MTVRAWLEPRIDPNEDLVLGCSERPVVHLAEGNRSKPLTLGRGAQTGIADLALGDRLVDIVLCAQIDGEPALKATPLAGFSHARLHVNGNPIRLPPGQSMYLFRGDVLSLDNLRYEYKVHFDDSSSAKRPSRVDPLLAFASNKVKRENSSSTPTGSDLFDGFAGPSPAMSPLTVPSVEEEQPDGVRLSSDHVNKLSEEIQCCVCLEIQVHPRTLHPCGHTFCLSCVAKLQLCPQCRNTISSHTPARTLDNLITTLVSVPNMLPEDDVEQYKTRKKKTDASIANARTRKPRKRQRSDVTAYATSPSARVASIPSHPSFGAIARPLYAAWQASAAAAAAEASLPASANAGFSLSQMSASMPFGGAPVLQPTVTTAAERRLRGNHQGASQADPSALTIDCFTD
eukprot:CAMPEP_0116999984 /NCGR_PEP_ID=MMETSP0472-20121206/2492_1 /TAXON_ID=693140 ORGANISM="Tiarina fusus, Strain LIS" /NCGR_SAMPLE_ID=MMETSP0472 /ASSEMBLY_ACC=CAM_ASM_000603 /LENGTH=400 /DNA_ID=CAMNT_0004699555 /DNA_START=200 /DNA_END=1403 /DNA_ORIENTATION=+